MKNSLLIFLIISSALFCISWGFFGHQKINRTAVFTLPGGMIRFYKNNLEFITAHAVNADKRRYSDTSEAARHFIDADRYGKSPFDSIPEKWKNTEIKFTRKILQENGIVPWQIERTYYSLVQAFQQKDSIRILRLSADLGHYVSDAHVPLHTTENYNGQLTGQTGIHGFWESRLPELFFSEYDLFTGRARYIENPLKTAWDIVKTSHSYTDSVLKIEAGINRKIPSGRKFSFSERNGIVTRQYSEEYAYAYHQALKGMVERQLRSSILMTGNYWYSAWVDAGQPRLKDFETKLPDDSERLEQEKINELFKKGKILGRTEN